MCHLKDVGEEEGCEVAVCDVSAGPEADFAVRQHGVGDHVLPRH